MPPSIDPAEDFAVLLVGKPSCKEGTCPAAGFRNFCTFLTRNFMSVASNHSRYRAGNGKSRQTCAQNTDPLTSSHRISKNDNFAGEHKNQLPLQKP